jgi:hypothetical protein
MQAVLNTSALQQRARMLVPAIVQGLTRRPAARDLHVQGAPVFAKANAGGTALNTAQQSSARGGGCNPQLSTARSAHLRHSSERVPAKQRALAA